MNPFESLVRICPSILLCAAISAQGVVGVVVDRGRASPERAPYVHTFDPLTMQITGSVALPRPGFTNVFDVEIAPDLATAYVSDFDGDQIWVIDLTTSPPVLAAGTNPIPVTGPSVQDIVLTKDGRFLVASTGNGLAPNGTGSSLCVVDLATRTEVSTWNFAPFSPTAVETTVDGSVLVGELVVSQSSFAQSIVHRFTLDAQGQLHDTGETAAQNSVPGVQNLLVPYYPQAAAAANAAVSRHVLHVCRPAAATMGSLQLQGLAVAQNVALPNPTGIDMCFDPTRSVVYVRTNELGVNGGAGVGNSRIDGYFFHPVLGRFSTPFVTMTMERRAGTAFGVEQTAVDPGTGRVFASGLAGGEIRVFDAASGTQVGRITHPDFLWGLGVAIRRR